MTEILNHKLWIKGAFVALVFFVGCTKKASGPLTGDELVQRGRLIYSTNCTSCHNSDPKRAGSIGPDVFGASLELLELRVSKAQYPQGYKPKRETSAMPALPQLAIEVPALHAYLNAK